MKRVFLIRHHEISDSESGRFYGQTDIGLSPRGVEQADLLVRKLAREKIGIVYSSDLFRTQYPARLLAQNHNIQYRNRKELREIHFGEWEGKTFREIERSTPNLYRNWLDNPYNFQFPEGESIGKFCQRVKKEYYSILNDPNQNNPAIITHGGVIRILLCEILKWDLANMWRIQIDFGALNIIDYYYNEAEAFGHELPKFQDAHPIVLTINDAAYLQRN